jgi:hypothetical protein
LTEAFAKLNQVPLALFPSDNDSDNENVFNIVIEMTGTNFILLATVPKLTSSKILVISTHPPFDDVSFSLLQFFKYIKVLSIIVKKILINEC